MIGFRGVKSRELPVLGVNRVARQEMKGGEIGVLMIQRGGENDVQHGKRVGIESASFLLSCSGFREFVSL